MEHSSFPVLRQHQQQLISWKPFSLTYITYPILVVSDSSNSNATSNVSLLFLPQLMALLSLFPIFFISSLTTCTIVYKDMVAAFLLLGTLLIALCTSWLKKMIGEPRPPSHRDDDDNMEYGMPSNHSSVAFFGATFIILYVLYYYHQRRPQRRHRQGFGSVGIGRNELSSTASSSTTMNGNTSTSCTTSSSSFQSLVSIAVRWLYYQLHTTIPVLSSLCIASGCAYSRVYLQYHTWNQVIVGSLLGIGGGVLWFVLFRMEIVQEKLTWLDGMIQELELERDILPCDDDDNGNNERKKK